MSNKTVKNCPGCGQQLRFPQNVGGVVMACPSCGRRFNSDFKLGKLSVASTQKKRKQPVRRNSPKTEGGVDITV